MPLNPREGRHRLAAQGRATEKTGENLAATIRSRLVLIFPGFEKTTPASQLDRLRHCANKTGEIWKFGFERLSVEAPDKASHVVSESKAAGANWHTETRTVLFSWNDIIEDYESEPHPNGFLRNMPKFLAFFGDGTVRRYWQASLRYFLFTIFPLLLIAIFLIGTGLLSWYVAGLGLSGIGRTIAAFTLTIFLTLVLCKWPGERMYLLLTINDWGFARDMVNRVNPRIEQRYRDFAAKLAEEIKASKHDEIVISGHSFGAVWAVAALALALEADPKLIAEKRVTFLALGSSLLKIALAPGAQFLRDWTRRVMEEPTLFWHEIQTKDDLIAFYKADPFEVLGISGMKAGVRIDRIRYKQAMKKARYKKMRRSAYDTHRQYILYQDVRVPFDYIMRICGPFESRDIAHDPHRLQAIDAEGRLV
jgi:hypothetical protein